MASTFHALICAALATLLWTSIGLPIARRLNLGPLALPLAPMLGWAIQSAIVLPVFFLVGFSHGTVLAVTGLSLIATVAALWLSNDVPSSNQSRVHVPMLAFTAAALLALGPAAAILPKVTNEGIALAGPIFDHAKIAMIDEMARLGVPAGNPFFGEVGAPPHLAYYYLWHFSAAELALLTGLSGWEADAGLTWFTAFSSLTVMMGLAAKFSGRASTTFWVVLLSAAASARNTFAFFLGDTFYSFLLPPTGFAGWLFQAAWVPQHIASATCVLLAVVLIGQLVERRSPLVAASLALVVVAGYESSAWIGGVTFAIAAVVIGLIFIKQIKPGQRLAFLTYGGIAAVIAISLASPFLYDQYIETAMRNGGSPIEFESYEVLGPLFTDNIRSILDIPAYWLILLPIEFPAIYLTGSITLARLIKDRDQTPDRKRFIVSMALLTGISLMIPWLFTSTLGDNNDLGWRAVLPGVMILIIFSATGLTRRLKRPISLAAGAAAIMLLLGLPDGMLLIESNAIAQSTPSAKLFAQTPALWEAVRRHSAPSERVGNNPLFLDDVTPWSVNISWALLSNRRSCYANKSLVEPYAPLPEDRLDAIDAQFVRVFRGEAGVDDVKQLALQYGCGLIVVTPQDGAWSRDPFAASPYYQLVETKPDAWRIYKSITFPNQKPQR